LSINGYYTSQGLPVVGVMSVIDVDVANLKRFLSGTFDGQFANGLASTSIDTNGGEGWIMYLSDRRGDFNNNGSYDMTNIFVTNPATDTSLQSGEDINGDGVLLMDYTHESARYSVGEATDYAAFWDHSYFRRSARLINGTTLPGNTNEGFTFASENPVYILGNYNATGVSSGASSSGPTPYSGYTGSNVPASVVGDVITFLSSNWADGESFRYPYSNGPSSDANARYAAQTTVRAAMIAGQSKSWILGTPNQGGSNPCLGGGVHNFMRLLENWSGVSLNYCGSLISLYYSHQATGSRKYGGSVGVTYVAPDRNWVFDATFLNATQVPPGTPYFQYVNMTGFRQTLR